jgi:diguanylate cyclase (GGDEF)-like protein
LAQFEAWHDPLTGVLNRRAFFEQGQTLMARANRHGFNVALIMLDLDQFKLVNDRYGHDAGDRLLRSVAQCCTAVTRRGDLCARLGGEEFVLLLEDTDPADATGVAERVRQMISTLKRGESEDAVTASFGVSMLVGAIKTLDELLHDADRLLYVAKNTGRNRVVMNDLPSPPSAAQTSAAAVVG